MNIATATTPTSDIANMIAACMAGSTDFSFNLAEIEVMVPGMTATGAAAAVLWLLADERIVFARGCYSLIESDKATASNMAIVAREDRIGVYFTPVIATPSGDGTMAANLSTRHGSVCGPRHSTIRAAVEAVRTHVRLESAIAG